MRRTRSIAAAMLALALSLAAVAACRGTGAFRANEAAVRRVVELGRADNLAASHALDLCRFGARPAGSLAHEKACEWALERMKEFGLENVHLELVDLSAALGEAAPAGARPVANVVGDIPGSVEPDEYVIVGAHIDSTPLGTGATDNAAGSAAVLEAARLLAKSGAKPKRTIRFILFAGEESGLLGSKAYVAAHPELMPKISAMYNMDYGTGWISGVAGTPPMRNDLGTAFAAAERIDPAMPFRVEPVDYLPAVNADCCASANRSAAAGAGGCGGKVKVVRRTSDGRLEEVEQTLEELGIDPADLGPGEGVDSLGRRFVKGCGGAPAAGGDRQNACGVPSGAPSTASVIEGLTARGDSLKIMLMGSSDHAPFLAAGVPALFFDQGADSTVAYPIHSEKDTYEAIVPRYLEHSAVVIALGALGTADLDRTISRERLLAPDDAK